jgi:hypothetical protein
LSVGEHHESRSPRCRSYCTRKCVGEEVVAGINKCHIQKCMWPFPFPASYPTNHPSPGGAPDNSPGRKSWVSARRNAPSPGGTARSNGANVERTLLSAAFDLALGFRDFVSRTHREGPGFSRAANPHLGRRLQPRGPPPSVPYHTPCHSDTRAKRTRRNLLSA